MSEYAAIKLLVKEEHLEAILAKLPQDKIDRDEDACYIFEQDAIYFPIANRFKFTDARITLGYTETCGETVLGFGLGYYEEQPVTIALLKEYYAWAKTFLLSLGFTEEDLTTFELLEDAIAVAAVEA